MIRGAALLGVLLVNLETAFRVSIFSQFLPQQPRASALNRIAELAVSVGLEFKAFILFALLFGVGLAIQYERLERTGRPLYWLARRILVLLAFGGLHLFFVWNGDILTEYAVAGLIVLPLLRRSNQWIVVCCALAFLVYFILPIVPPLLAMPGPDWMQHHIGDANTAYATGGHLQVIRFNIAEVPFILPLHVYVLPRTIGLFLSGILLWRSGFIVHAKQYVPTIRSWTTTAIGIGALLTAVSRWPVAFTNGLPDWFGKAVDSTSWLLVNVAPIVLALGYGLALFALSENQRTRGLLRPLAAVGRMAFTNYLCQSLVLGFVFFGYGFGLFGRVGAFPALLLGLVLYGLQISGSNLWLRHFRYGPFEWIWRSLTYGRMPRILLDRGDPAAIAIPDTQPE
jgi:uncharacterized protein